MHKTITMKVGLLKNFLHYFTLRQGTVLVATFQMLMSTYVIIFLILGLSQESRIQLMIARDTDDALEREALEEITSKHINTERMQLAGHRANEEITLMYCGLVIILVLFATTVLLLCGALKKNRHLMAPWLTFTMTFIVSMIISLFLCGVDSPFFTMFGRKADMLDRVLLFVIILMDIYAWLVVHSTYKFLELEKGVVYEVHGVMKMPDTRSAVEKKSRGGNTVHAPFDV